MAAAVPSTPSTAAASSIPASATVVLQRWQKAYDLTDCQCDVLRPEVEALIDGGHVIEQIAAMEADIKTQEYILQSCLGTGSFGAVYKGLRKKDGLAVAVKIIDLESTNEDMERITGEIMTLVNASSCPQLLRYHGSHVYGTKLWIMMEFVDGGSVFDRIRRVPLEEEHVAIITREILLGLQFLWLDGKIHRDIKSSNILLSSTGAVKLADFGASRQLTETMNKAQTFIGSPHWMAPEVITGAPYDGKADIWSLGITCLEMIYGKPPHADLPPMKVIRLIPKSVPPTPSPSRYSPAFCSFVAECLAKDPARRATISELLKHPFIVNAAPKLVLPPLPPPSEAVMQAPPSPNLDPIDPSAVMTPSSSGPLTPMTPMTPAGGYGTVVGGPMTPAGGTVVHSGPRASVSGVLESKNDGSESPLPPSAGCATVTSGIMGSPEVGKGARVFPTRATTTTSPLPATANAAAVAAAAAIARQYSSLPGPYPPRLVSTPPKVITAAGPGRGDTALSQPTGLAVEHSTGTVLLADSMNHRIRKMAPLAHPPGMMFQSTLAGNGRAGLVDKPGEAAQFATPTDIVCDHDGNSYIADTQNHRIRKIGHGPITTFAGKNGGYGDGQGSAASFNRPTGVAMDRSARYLYVADCGNHVIRRIEIATQAVTTIAGVATRPGFVDGTATEAQFDSPWGIAVRGDDHVFVTDQANARIRMIDLVTSQVTTVAGTGIAAFQDGPIATATFSWPFGICVDRQGDLLVADSHRIRRISEGKVTTVAGKGEGMADGSPMMASFSSPRGIACDPAGNVYIGDAGNNRLRKIVYSCITPGCDCPRCERLWAAGTPLTDRALAMLQGDAKSLVCIRSLTNPSTDMATVATGDIPPLRSFYGHAKCMSFIACVAPAPLFVFPTATTPATATPSPAAVAATNGAATPAGGTISSGSLSPRSRAAATAGSVIAPGTSAVPFITSGAFRDDGSPADLLVVKLLFGGTSATEQMGNISREWSARNDSARLPPHTNVLRVVHVPAIRLLGMASEYNDSDLQPPSMFAVARAYPLTLAQLLAHRATLGPLSAIPSSSPPLASSSSSSGSVGGASPLLCEAEVLHVARQVSAGLLHLARCRLVHRSATLDNLFIEPPHTIHDVTMLNARQLCRSTIVVGGLSDVIDLADERLATTDSRVIYSHAIGKGHTSVQPPEVAQVITTGVASKITIDYSGSDSWALGLVLHAMICGPSALPQWSDEKLRPLSGIFETHYSAPLRSIVAELLRHDVKQRLPLVDADRMLATLAEAQPSCVRCFHIIDASSSAATGAIDVDAKKHETILVPDEKAPHCGRCKVAFSTLKRRHHCRCCGDVFCGLCSSRQVNQQRACEACWRWSLTPDTARYRTIVAERR